MKKTLILVIAIVISITTFFACTKKKPSTHCYLCQRYELIYSPLYPQFDKPRTLVAVDTLCDRNDAWIQLYMESHKRLDTIYRGTKNDSIILNQRSSLCDLE